MSYKVIVVRYKCNWCGKELLIEHKKENYKNANNYPSLEINCPKDWAWTSPSEYSANKHCCKDEWCQKKLREDRLA